jgi:hypothetical protein
LHQFGNAIDGLLYAPLFCPPLIEVEGSVLLDQGNTAKRFVDAKLTGTMSLRRLEASFNLLEVSYAFSNRARDTGDEGDLLAQFVAEAWRGRLALLYPLRRFEVLVLSPEKTGSVTAVQFSELR